MYVLAWVASTSYYLSSTDTTFLSPPNHLPSSIVLCCAAWMAHPEPLSNWLAIINIPSIFFVYLSQEDCIFAAMDESWPLFAFKPRFNCLVEDHLFQKI